MRMTLQSQSSSLLHESFIEEAQNTIEKRMIDLEESITNEDLPNSENDDEKNLNLQKIIIGKSLKNFSVTL